MSFAKQLNETYLKFHTGKEDAFWTAKMNLKGNVPGALESREVAFQEFISDASWIKKVRESLDGPSLTPEERTALLGWKHFFEVNALENEDAKKFRHQMIEKEGALQRDRRDMKLGYTDPKTSQFVEAPVEVLGLMISTSKEEPIRKAAWQGFRSIEKHLLDKGYLEIVRMRNRFARMLGFEDYYDYKVTLLEGMSKKQLFTLLDDLEKNTRESCQQALDEVVRERGESAREPWNFGHFISGALTTQLDPYFQFDTAVERWGKSFAAMGIRYHGATLTLDLVSRKGKYENGFMHGPFPGFIDDGTYRPARINFTANAVPGQVGSGFVALETLLHEGGHAAHFSNIMMPAPCFSQEFAPTSAAFAETQSMFLDSIAADPDWCARYARNRQGEAIPWELQKKRLEKNHRFQGFYLRGLMAVCYGEKAIYEMSDNALTSENVLSALREVEHRLLRLTSASRPILAVPHLLSAEASATYHAYVLAQMAVFQTRSYFQKKYGYIVDNPVVGKQLAEKYWKPGNSKTFPNMIAELTGEPFSAKATIELVNKSVEEVFAEAEADIKREATIPKYTKPVELDCTIRMMHGDEVVATTESGSFESMAEKYASWIREKAAERSR
jgi:hypothetical protein